LASKGSGGAATEGKKEMPVVSDRVKITADKATNSLVVQADKEEYRVLEEIIKKLDIPRAMVYIEALIMEVNVDDGLQLGIDWSVFGATDVSGEQAVVGGGFSAGILGPGSIAPGAKGGSGFSLGIISQPITIGGITVSNLAAIAKAVRTNTNANILSTPQLLTTDNEEASITVGKNLPFQTRATATATGTTVVDTGGSAYFSYEYKDVGKILKITPHISEERRVRLKISLEVTDVINSDNDRPTTSKRTVETTVIVDDGNTLVLGGLIDDKIDKIDRSVPCLGGIPGAGWLFKTVTDITTKSNLYIFLSPRVVKNQEEALAMSREKKQAIDAKVNEGRIKLYDRLPATP
jgi:general secretion pathway protein D